MQYLCSCSTDFDEIWYDDASYGSQPDGKPKISTSKMVDGSHIENHCDISETVRPISPKLVKRLLRNFA